jgi:hypothetical protein
MADDSGIFSGESIALSFMDKNKIKDGAAAKNVHSNIKIAYSFERSMEWICIFEKKCIISASFEMQRGSDGSKDQ